MEYGASDHEQPQMCTTIKTEEERPDTSSVYIEINPNSLKPEPVLVHSVKSEPVLLVKEEVLEDGSHDSCELQCVQDTPVSTGGGNETCSTSLHDLLNVKYESADIDIEPTVLQHMDVRYTITKSPVDGSNEALRYSRIKKSVENKLRDTFTPQNMTMKERSVRERQLASVCRVHVMRLNVLPCDTCHAVYTDKLRLLQHLQTEHAGRQLTSLVAKVRKTNKRTIEDNMAKTKVDYDKVHMKSLLGHQVRLEKVDIQKHLLHRHSTSSSNSLMYDRMFRKPQLLSARNKPHQRNSRKAVTTKGTVAGPSNQSGDKGIKTKQTKNIGVSMGHKIFQCKICHAKLAERSCLTRHMRVHTGEKPYECDACHVKFTQRHDLTRHKRIHTGEKPYECEACHSKFARTAHLQTHMRVHTGVKPYECHSCYAKFAHRGGLTIHMRVHTGEKPYECGVCHAKFAHSGVLTTHMRLHTGEKPYHCNVCHAKFAQTGQLNTHMKVHTGEKPYECDACHSKFANKAKIKRHMKVHTGEKPYECDACHAKFAYRSVLTKHRRIHTGEKPYECDACHAKFAYRSVLTQHRRVHTGEKPYECDACHAKFSERGSLITHLRVHTGEKPYECDACHVKFAHRSVLTRHMRVHMG